MNYLFLWPVSTLIALGLASFTPWEQVSLFNQTRIVQLVLLFWVSNLLMFNCGLRDRVIQSISSSRPRIFLKVTAFWALGFISALSAQWPLFALQDWAHYLLLALSVVILANLASQNPRLAAKILMVGIVFGISLALARFIIQVILTFSMNVVTPLSRWWQPYSNPRFIAQALVWIVPLLTALPSMWPVFQKSRLAAIHALCCGAWMLLFWTGSRAEILSLVFSMALIAAVMRSQTGVFLARMGIHSLVGFLFYLLTRLVLNFGITGQDSSSLARVGVTGRDWLFELSLRLAMLHPWLGIGPAHFSAHNRSTDFAAHPHNLILQIAAEWGIPAAILLVYLICKFVQRQYQSVMIPLTDFDALSNLRSALRIPLLMTLFSVMFTALLDGIYVMPLSELIGVPVLGLMIGISSPEQSSGIQSQSYFRRLIMILMLFCWGIITFSIYRQRDCLIYPIRAEQLIGGQIGYDYPRLWAQGRIPLENGCLEIGRYQNGIDTLEGRPVDALSKTEQYWQ